MMKKERNILLNNFSNLMSAFCENWKTYFESVKMLKMHGFLKKNFLFFYSFFSVSRFSCKIWTFHFMRHVVSSQSPHEAVRRSLLILPLWCQDDDRGNVCARSAAIGKNKACYKCFVSFSVWNKPTIGRKCWVNASRT